MKNLMMVTLLSSFITITQASAQKEEVVISNEAHLSHFVVSESLSPVQNMNSTDPNSLSAQYGNGTRYSTRFSLGRKGLPLSSQIKDLEIFDLEPGQDSNDDTGSEDDEDASPVMDIGGYLQESVTWQNLF